MILDHFPSGLEPRPSQAGLLSELESLWWSHDVFVITAPTAFGKTQIAATLMRFARWASYIAPTNMLVDQASDAVPLAPVLRARDSYHCADGQCSCEERHRVTGTTCGEACPYERALKQARTRQMSITNYHTYLAHRLYKSTLIVDEAHLLVEMLQGLATKRLWRRTYDWPSSVRTLGDIVGWLEDQKAAGKRWDARMTKLYKEITSIKPSTLVVRTREPWRNSTPQDVLKLIPLDTRTEPPVLWPQHKVSKIVLMSATISHKDIESIGLDNRRVAYLNCESPIPVANRPIHYVPVGSMAYAHREDTLPHMITSIEYRMSTHPDSKGLIHATYDIAARLREEMGFSPRLMFHDRDSKSTVYDEWRASPPSEARVLVASGMYEGIDIAGDAGTWQLITKIPFPSMADPGIRAKLREDPDWYAWQTIKSVVQAAGRICRTPDDFGETFIMDSCWERVVREDQERKTPLIPKYFMDAYLTK